jgi:hypothetical protein
MNPAATPFVPSGHSLETSQSRRDSAIDAGTPHQERRKRFRPDMDPAVVAWKLRGTPHQERRKRFRPDMDPAVVAWKLRLTTDVCVLWPPTKKAPVWRKRVHKPAIPLVTVTEEVEERGRLAGAEPLRRIKRSASACISMRQHFLPVMCSHMSGGG